MESAVTAERKQGAEGQPKSSNQGRFGTGDEHKQTGKDQPRPLRPVGTEKQGTKSRIETQKH